jgi:Family of unknown function (DUF6518)
MDQTALRPSRPDQAAPDPWLSGVRVVAGALAVGVAWGFLTQVLQGDIAPPWSTLVNAVSPWVAPAFVMGCLARHPLTAALAGLALCTGENVGYYAAAVNHGWGLAVLPMTFWTLAGLVGGPVFGWAGWCWRRRGGELGALAGALLPAAFLSEGVVTFGMVNHAWAVTWLFAAIAAATAFAIGRRVGWRATLSWLPVALVLGAAGELALALVLLSAPTLFAQLAQVVHPPA